MMSVDSEKNKEKPNNPKTPKEHFVQSGKYLKSSGNNFVGSLLHAIVGTHKAVDILDKAIGKRLKPSKNKITNFTRNNLIKILIPLAAVTTYGGIKAHNDNEKKDILAPEAEYVTGLKNIDFETNKKDTFWNKGSFFDTNYFHKKNVIQVLDESTILLFDGGGYFYLMLPKDLKETRVETINSIRTKLSKYKMFNYLSNPEFAPSNESVTNTFNIRPDYRSLAQNSSLTKNPFWIPIPLDKKVSKISNKEFYTASQKAIDLLPTYNKTYGEIINKILEKMDKNTLSELLTIIALLETGQTIGTIGSDEYHRREEGSHNCFSFGPQHVLMEGPGIDARLNLKLTELQIYHPIISNMLCLGFLIEKSKGNIDNTRETAKLTTEQKQEVADKLYEYIKFMNEKPTTDNLVNFATFYNGAGYKSNLYDTRFIQSHDHLENSLKAKNTPTDQKGNDVVVPKNPNIHVGGFEFLKPIKKNGDTTYYIYSYTIKKQGTPKDIIAIFTDSAKAFNGKKIVVTDAKSNKYNDDTSIPAGKTVRLKVKIK